MVPNSILPGMGRGTMRSMVEGGWSPAGWQGLAGCSAGLIPPSTAVPAVPLPASGEDIRL